MGSGESVARILSIQHSPAAHVELLRNTFIAESVNRNGRTGGYGGCIVGVSVRNEKGSWLFNASQAQVYNPERKILGATYIRLSMNS